MKRTNRWALLVGAASILAGCDNADTVTNLTKYRDQVNRLVSQQTALLNRLNGLKAQRDKEQTLLKTMQGPEVGKDLAQMGPDLEKTTNGKVSTNDKLPNGQERLVIAGSGGPATSIQSLKNISISAPGVVLVQASLNANDWSAELQQPWMPPAPTLPPSPSIQLADGGFLGLPPMPEAKGTMGLPPGSKTKDMLAEISGAEDKLKNLVTATAELPQVQLDKAKLDQQLRDMNAPNRAKNAQQLVELVMNGNPPLLTDGRITFTNDGQAEIQGDLGPGHQAPELTQRVGVQWDLVSSTPSGKSGVDVKLRKKGAMAPGFPAPPRPVVQQPVQQQPVQPPAQQANQREQQQHPGHPQPGHPPPPNHNPPGRPPPPAKHPTSH